MLTVVFYEQREETATFGPFCQKKKKKGDMLKV